MPLDFRKPRSSDAGDRPASRSRPTPLNLRSRTVQIRLMICVAIVLGGLTVVEGLISGRFSLDDLEAAKTTSTQPVETRLTAQPPTSIDSLASLSMPATPRPWQASAAPAEKLAAPKSDEQVETDFWRRLYQSLSVKQRDHLQASLRFALRSRPLPLGTSDRAELLRNLRSHAESYQEQGTRELAESKLLTPERQAEFKSSLEKTMIQWRDESLPALSKTLNAESLSASDKEKLTAIESMWRGLSLNEVQDDEPSPSKDFVAWFGLFDNLKHDAGALQAAEEVSYTNLFDQAAQFRGKPVLVRGVIRGAEYIKARPNLYGVEGYYVCWIRPDNYRDAPIKVFSLTAPKGSVINGRDFSPLVDRQCELRGLFFKRMVYRAQDDIRAVPTVLSADMTLVAADTSVREPSESIGLVMIILLVAVVGAVILSIYFFTDRNRIRSLPEKLDLPAQPVSEK